MKCIKNNSTGLFTGIVEVWKDIEDFKGLYQVSSFGNVRGLDRLRVGKGGSLVPKKGQLLAKKTSKTGYLIVGLCKNAEKYHPSIHRLVAKAFIHNYLSKETVNHKDGVKTNNNVRNLEWNTHAEQMQHAFENKLATPRGNMKYSKNFRVEVKEYFDITGCSITQLAKYFGLSERTAGRMSKSSVVGKDKKISDEDCIDIKEMRSKGMTLKAISQVYGCGISQIHRITNNLSHNVQYER